MNPISIEPGRGWDLFLACRSVVRQNQIVFAADSIISLPLKDQVKGKFLYQIALRIPGLSS